MLATMEAEPEVMGTPGRVRDMIARFSHLSDTATSVAKPGTNRNGTSPTDYDVADNGLMSSPAAADVLKRVFKPVLKDNAVGEHPHHNNNNKVFRNELDSNNTFGGFKSPEFDSEEPDNIIMNYRKKLRPVANSVILTENGIDNDVTDVDSDVTHADTDVTHVDSDVTHAGNDVTPAVTANDVTPAVTANDVTPAITANDVTPAITVNDVTPPVIANDVSPTVTANGSEPSLVSRNGQRSSVTASKRTLVSQDTNPSPKVDADNRASSQPTLLDSGTMPTTMTTESFESIDTTPKTPSYMKISCALSGYNRYNTYTSPKQEAKLRVIKLGEQNGSHSSLSSQQSDSSAEVRNYSDLSIKVTDEPEPIKNGIAPSELLTNGSSHHSISSGAATSATTNGAEHVSIVMNGRTEGDSVTNEVGEEDSNDKYITKAMVNLQPSGSPTMMSASELKLQWEDKRKTEMRSAVSTPSPSKDGHYYFPVLEREVSRIRGLCAPCEVDMHDESLPEEASGKIRAAIGKSNLLINKKFEQFRGLCERNINQSSDEGFLTTVTDLAGFWDMVCLQISDINTMFKDIETMRQSGWTIAKDSPVKTQSTTKGCLKGGKSPRGKTSSTATPVKTAKPAVSAKAEEAMKARDLARKRLLAAKRAGRQRKASQSDKDEIEIFVAE